MQIIHEKLGLWKISERVYVLIGGVNVVIVRTNSGALIIDSGQDKDYGRNIRKALTELDLTPHTLLTSHAHADHYGGHEYLQRQFPDMRTLAPPFEAAIIQNPYLEPVYLFHGAKPPKELQTKWLMAKPAKVDEILALGITDIDGVAVEVLSFPGHAHEQYGVLIDGVLFAADSVFGTVALEKYTIPFVQDVAALRLSFTVLREAAGRCSVLVPGHGQPTTDPLALITLNERANEQAGEAIFAAVDGQNTSELVRDITAALSLDMGDLARYQLNVCAIHAHLSDFLEQGLVQYELNDGLLSWTRD